MLLLDTLDHKLLARLRRGEAHTSQISLETDIPRTSVAYRLKRLEGLRKVTKRTSGRKTLWRISTSRIHNKGHITEFKGADFMESYKTLMLLPKDATIYAVQGSSAGEAELRHLSKDFIKEILSFYKRRHIIMRGISNKKLLDTLAQLSVDLREGHALRPQSIKLTEKLFTGDGELFATKYFIILANPKEKRGLVIKEPSLVSIIYDLMIAFFALSDKLDTFDMKKYFEKVSLEEK